MNRWVAFLRAINTGNRRVKGDRLVRVFESLGFESVSSFQASGNVLFSAEAPDKNRIEEALERELGYPVPTMLRTATETRRIASERPFTEAELRSTQGRIQVMLLRDPISTGLQVGGLPDIPDDDLVRVRPGEVFWLPRVGISASRLSPPAVERLVGPLTVRTHTTIRRIADRL
jgi:uncharacterized protein (DUF1697 family)